MENLTCKGLSAAHRRMLIKCITEEIGSIPEPVEIEFMEPIRRKQYSSLWYGGQIAAIRVHGCVFEVHALGDVYAWLYDKSDRDRELLYVKDKNNSGRFGSDIQPYLKTDRALVAAICRKHNFSPLMRPWVSAMTCSTRIVKKRWSPRRRSDRPSPMSVLSPVSMLRDLVCT